MKMKSKLTLLGSVMVLATSPLAFAEKAGPAVCEAAPDVVVEEPVKDTKVDEPAAETVDDKTTDVANEGEVTDEGSVVPIDWVKRGGGDNPEIYQNMVGGEAPVFKEETTSVAKELGQDEKAADIESKETSGAPLIERAKKGPVALLKKGRVFLR